jgi:hypothetical protein
MLKKGTSFFYEAHRGKLRAKHAGKRVVIVENQILGTYNTDGEALY